MSGPRPIRARSLPIAVLALLFLAVPFAPAGAHGDGHGDDRDRGRSDECGHHGSSRHGGHDACEKRHGRHGADVIFVSDRAAYARAIELLRGRHALRPLGRKLGHVIVTPEDLTAASMREYLRRAYAAGYTVAVTSARADHARLLEAAAGATSSIYLGDSCPSIGPDTPGSTGLNIDASRADDLDGALVLLRRHDEDDGGGQRIHSLWVEAVASAKSGNAGREWLSDRFRTDAPTAGLGTKEVCADPDSCLQQISQAKVFESQTSDQNGNFISIQNEIYSTRSFTQGLDYYFVSQTGTYNLYQFDVNYNFYDQMRTTEISTGPSSGFVVDLAPASTTCTDTLITSETKSVGGSVGASSTKGGATFTGGVQYGTQTRVDCPGVEVFNRSSDMIGSFYRYTYDLPQSGDIGSNIANQFVFVVPVFAETSEVAFSTTATLTGCIGCATWPSPAICLSIGTSTQTLDFPFPTATTEVPNIGSVSPSTVSAGDPVTISGHGFYLNSLAAVTIGGIAVPAANILPPSDSVPADQEIQLLMPSARIPRDTPLPVVVHTVYGISNDDQTITLQSSQLGAARRSRFRAPEPPGTSPPFPKQR